MSKFITFNGVDFLNSDKIEKISVKTNEKNISNKVYLYFTIAINDKVVFESEDYKVTDGQFSTPNGLNDFHKSYESTILAIKNI